MMLDLLVPGVVLAQSLGRWGNYFNSEAYGLPVASQKWGLFIPQNRRIAGFSEYELFHPTFLYESILDLISFFILLFIYKKFGKNYKGIVFFAYLTVYAIIRFFIEKIRIDSALNIGSIPIAQIVSVILFITGILGIITVLKKSKNPNLSNNFLSNLRYFNYNFI